MASGVGFSGCPTTNGDKSASFGCVVTNVVRGTGTVTVYMTHRMSVKETSGTAAIARNITLRYGGQNLDTNNRFYSSNGFKVGPAYESTDSYTFNVGAAGGSITFRVHVGITLAASSKYRLSATSGSDNEVTIYFEPNWAPLSTPVITNSIAAVPVGTNPSRVVTWINGSGAYNGVSSVSAYMDGVFFNSQDQPEKPTAMELSLYYGLNTLSVGTHYFQIYNEAMYGAGSMSAPSYFQVYRPAPVVTGLKSDSGANILLAGSGTTISWNAVDMAGYNTTLKTYEVYCNGIFQGATLSTFWSITSPSAGSSNYYQIKALDNYGTSQGISSSLYIYGASIGAPGVITLNSQDVTSVFADNIRFSWTAPSVTCAISYKIRYYLKYSNSTTSQIGDIIIGSTSDLSFNWAVPTNKVNYNQSIRIFVFAELCTNANPSVGIGLSPERYSSSILRMTLATSVSKSRISTNTFINVDDEAIAPERVYTTGNSTPTGSFQFFENDMYIEIFSGTMQTSYEKGVNISIDGVDRGNFFFTPQTTDSKYTYVIPTSILSAKAPGSNLVISIQAIHRRDSIIQKSASVDITVPAGALKKNTVPQIDRYTSGYSVLSVGGALRATVDVNYNEGSGIIIQLNDCKITSGSPAGFKDDSDNYGATTLKDKNCGFKLYYKLQNESSYRTVTQNLFDGVDGKWISELNAFFPKITNTTDTSKLTLMNLSKKELNEYLKTVLGSLYQYNQQTTIFYRLVPIDSLRKENPQTANITIENITNNAYPDYVPFEITYDFRNAPKTEIAPKLTGDYSSFPVVDVPITKKPNEELNPSGTKYTAMLLSNQDAIFFEWYPAYDVNKKYTDDGITERYVEINGKHYLLADKEDPITSYQFRLYSLSGLSYVEKQQRRHNLTMYKTSETIEGTEVLKYVGYYNTSLSNVDIDEMVMVQILPIANDKEESFNSSQLGTTLSVLQKNILVKRITKPNIINQNIIRSIVDDTKATLTLQLEDNGSSKTFNTGKVATDSWSSFNNLLQLDNTYVSGTITSTDSYLNADIPFRIDSDTMEISGLSSRQSYVFELTAKISFKRAVISIVNNFPELLTINDSLISIISTFYLPPAFGTLSLRKNKVGINKSDLGEIEESLTIVSRDETTGKPYIKNIAAIYGNSHTKMPNFNGIVDEEAAAGLGLPFGAYLRFDSFLTENDLLPTWVGSIGFEADGFAYVVEKSEEDPTKKIKRRIGSGGGGPSGNTGLSSFVIGDGTAKSFSLTHGRDTDKVIVMITDNATKQNVIPDFVKSTNNSVTVFFKTAPTTKQYTVDVYALFPTTIKTGIYETNIGDNMGYEFMIVHNLKMKYPEVKVINNENDEKIYARETYVDDNTLKISFGETSIPAPAQFKVRIANYAAAVGNFNETAILDKIFFVGRVLMTTNDTNPAEYLGIGTWQLTSQGRSPLGAGSILANTTNAYGAIGANEINRPVNERGGELTHKLTLAELASHSHYTEWYYSGVGSAADPRYIPKVDGVNVVVTGRSSTTSGGDIPHNNIGPYETFYFWKRVA